MHVLVGSQCCLSKKPTGSQLGVFSLRQLKFFKQKGTSTCALYFPGPVLSLDLSFSGVINSLCINRVSSDFQADVAWQICRYA